MTSKKDYYEILGLQKNASSDDIKKAFRNLARKHHPDVNKEPDSDVKFKEINEAYQVLSDPRKRQQYDNFGTSDFSGGGFGQGFQGFDFNQGFGDFEGFSDIFDAFFGGGGKRAARRSGRQDGADLRYDLELTLEEAYRGIEKEIEISHLVACQACKGSGAKPGTTPVKCQNCGGTGQVRKTQRTPLGAFTQVIPCPTCQGSGETISTPCPQCSGSGRTRSKHKVKIKVPAGIDSGTRMRVSGAGDAGLKGGSPGDLYVFIEVRQHGHFERDGDNLFIKKMITFVQASLGDELEVPTLDGKATLKIPRGTQSGTSFRFKGKGMPSMQGRGRGDLIVLVEIETPANLTSEQEELLKRFAKLRGERRA